MGKPPIEKRVEVLERELAALKTELGRSATTSPPWWEQIAGTFADDPAHEEAMRLGRAYRDSLRPKAARTR